jgi:allophanate hydrolase subunit 2
LGGVGPPALASDSLVCVGPDPQTPLAADHAPVRRTTGVRLRIWDGPQHDWFIGGTQGLIGRPWRVTNELSRVGVRLEAGEFARTTRSRPQMASIGLTIGAVQITSAGEPIVMLANHPTTGGYPVIGVVDPDDLAHLVQARPGSSVQFRRA